MAVNETSIVNEIMKDVSPFGVRLFRNVRGMFFTLDGARKIMAGLLIPGASDLVGFKPVIITQGMVGQKIAVFSVVEVKTATGRVRPEQAHFINVVKENGGFAGVARSPEDALKILEISY